MKNKSLVIIIVQSVLIISLLWLIIYISKDQIFFSNDDFDLKIIDKVEEEDFLFFKNKSITLPEAIIKNSGIEIREIKKSNQRSLYSSHGSVVNLKSLINYEANYSNLNFKFNQLRKQQGEEIKHFEILKSLNYDNKNIADSEVHEKEIFLNNLQNEIKIIKNNKRNILNIIRNEWGDKFTELLTNPNKSILKNIFNLNTRLLKVSITNNQIMKQPPLELSVFSLNQPNIMYSAKLISKAPIGDSDIQGKSFFYLASNNDLAIGEKINSYIEIVNKSSVTKFFIPASSIIWDAGKPWIYENVNKNKFVRRAIFKIEEVSDGWMVQFENKSPKVIVTNGAQLLLSEEYKHLITNENED